MKSQLFASAAFVLLSAVPGALSAEEAKLQGAVAVTSFEDQLADFFDEEEVSEDEDNMDLWSWRWSGKSRKSCSSSLLDECEDARRAVRRGRRVRSRGRSFSSFRDLCSDACDVRIPGSSHRRRRRRDRDYSGKSEKDDRDRRRRRRRRDSRDKGGKSDKSDFFYDEEASEDEDEDEDFILTETESGKHHHDCVYLGNGMWACGGRGRGRGGHWGWGKSEDRGFWRPKSDKETSEDEDFILTESGKHHHWGKGTHRVWYGKSGHRVVWRGPKSDKVASEDEGYDS